MPLRILRRPAGRLSLQPRPGDDLSQQGVRAAARSNRPERRDSPTPDGPAQRWRACGRGQCQRSRARCASVAGAMRSRGCGQRAAGRWRADGGLYARRRGLVLARSGRGSFQSFGACAPAHPARVTDDCRPGGEQKNSAPARSGGAIFEMSRSTPVTLRTIPRS